MRFYFASIDRHPKHFFRKKAAKFLYSYYDLTDADPPFRRMTWNLLSKLYFKGKLTKCLNERRKKYEDTDRSIT